MKKDINKINAIIQRLRENEEIAKKFNRVEAKILTILNFKDLFEVLLSEIKNDFKVPYVWLTMIRNCEISCLLKQLDKSNLIRENINIIDDKVFIELIGNSTEPFLENQNLKPYFKLFPPHRKYFIKSLAVAPITLDGEIIGSLNQADSSPVRFQPGIDTSLLAQLAIKVSLCLSNVTAHEKLKFLAYHDPLTSLLNRRVMEKILSREFHRSKRYDNLLSLVFLDLDHFKHINDTYGHERGDELLIFVADTLTMMCRQSDIVARFAGDEFVLILPETDLIKAEYLMERIEAYFNTNPFVVNDMDIYVSISFGLICSADHPEISEPSGLLEMADSFLYKMKNQKASQPNEKVRADSGSKVISLTAAAALDKIID